MPKIKNLEGQRFGRLTVIKFGGLNKHHSSIWVCKCDCGNITKVVRSNLISGSVFSCGCVHNQKAKERMTIHGLSTTPEYKLWASIKRRCYDKNIRNYRWYGAKGIRVCDEWLNNPIEFCKWAKENGFKEDLTIDRIDANGNYEPSNCRFITLAENSSRANKVRKRK